MRVLSVQCPRYSPFAAIDIMHHDIVFYIFVIYTGSAILATLALYARQALLIAYILLGILMGPAVFNLVDDTKTITAISDIGIIFLLFLLGLHLQPQELLKMLHKTTILTLVSSSIFALVGFLVGWLFGFGIQNSIILGIALTFSSTIIGLKLLPTTVLHHRHAGEIIVSVLLMQDLIAIFVLIVLNSWGSKSLWMEIGVITFTLPALIGLAVVLERYVLIKLIARFDRIQEYIFLLTIGWCLGMAEIAAMMNLSHEIGAFIGGVALAHSPIARFIAENLKPLRDFFLIIFFFSLGATMQLDVLYAVLVPALVLSVLMLSLKPLVFRTLLVMLGEEKQLSMEMGMRLGHVSEFSLLIAVLALEVGAISQATNYLIQSVTVLTFVVSSYVIVMNYPTPIATSDRLRRD